MDKYQFKMTVTAETITELREVLEWCYENFGKSKDYDTHIKLVIDDFLDENEKNDYNERRWSYLRKSPYSIRVLFRDDIDAMAFRLRWL